MATARRSNPGTRRRYAPRLPPEERREQVLDAALHLIATQGYGGASMEALAREIGVTKPVVYDLFPRLGDVLRALLEREEERAYAGLAAAMPSPPPDADPDDLVIEGFTSFLRAVAEDPEAWRLILLPAEGTPKVVREHAERGRRTALRTLRQLVAWGVERRGGPAGLDVELAAHTLLGLGEYAARLVLTDPDRFPPERVGAFYGNALTSLPRGSSPAQR